MKTKGEYIKSIHVIDSNFEHIAKTGKINGTLLAGIERILDKYAEEYAKALLKWKCEMESRGQFELSDSEVEEEIKRFKESLKK